MSQQLHSAFKLNGLFYTEDALIQLANDLERHGHQHEKLIGTFLKEWFSESPFITVKTSGSTGIPKPITISKNAMINSAVATGDYFNLPPGTSALLCLSAGYIAGKMMLVRAMTLGWHLHIVAPEKNALTQYDNTYDFVAMVPYQVYHSISALQKVQKIIIGGSVISSELEAKLQNVKANVYATYGMTETVTHIAARAVNGTHKTQTYTALPNVTFSTDKRNCLIINAPSVAEDKVITNDVVQLLSPTEFIWKGRFDSIINSGGIKIFPEELEKKLASHIAIPFIITSETDAALGERIILVTEGNCDEAILTKAFSLLYNYQIPKKVYSFSKFPYTETGKIKRKEILNILKTKK